MVAGIHGPAVAVWARTPFAAAWVRTWVCRSRASFAKASATRSITARPPSNTRFSSRAIWTRMLADKFIGMYVNHWTLDYGEEGRRAVRELFARGAAGRARRALVQGRFPFRSCLTCYVRHQF